MKHLISCKRWRLLSTITVTVLLNVISVSTTSAQELSAVQLETTKLSDRIYMLEPMPPMAGNLAVSAGEDGIILVDDQMMPLTPKIQAAIAEIQKGAIAFVINTHYHFDHAGGNEAFGGESTIVAHSNVRKRLKEGREAGSRFIEGTRPSEALPVITFDESVTFHWNGEEVDVIHFPDPSHTDGDSVIFFRGSNVIHTGDQYVNVGGYPYIDQDVGGTAHGLRNNIAKLLKIIDDDTKIIPGHGPLARKADMQWFYDLVDETIGYIEAEKRAGKTLEEIQSSGLPKKFEAVGKAGFIPEAFWIQSVFASIGTQTKGS